MLLQIFAACPAPASPQWTILPPIFFQQRLGPVEAFRSAADHEGQGAGGSAADAAGNRRVEKLHPGFRRRGADLTGCVHVDGRAVDEQRAGTRRGDQPVGPKIHVADMLAARQHGDDGVGPVSHGDGGGAAR